MSTTATIVLDARAVDDERPWIGLASFTEESRSYFYGREEEVGELARRVQRKLLTVLFGQSGLGKTSILRAGLVPRLRDQGYCPVYVRVDYSREAPEPAEQIKQAIARTAVGSGEWTQAGVASSGESLWEFLHHRDDMLKDAEGRTLIPLLIFDQFEEIFTLGQTDEFGRARAARFITDLADLVENRAPASVEAKLEADDAAAEHFDFARSDYRVLIALREDYLAPLEGLKPSMPSITQNRQRLARMTGQQGLQAVLLPGKRLVSEEVAAAIVRFVAGGSELANAEVEPSLLSLICRELNDARLVQGRSEISQDLLAGSHDSILGNFYERSIADQPASVRKIIEDELLTDAGFRENIAEERLIARFDAAGAAPNTLALLVDRRLLRIEERLDLRRVELTHDVLCSVVKASRDMRHAREARESTERQLAEQRERELAARHALLRARKVATACIALAVVAVAAAVFAYFSTQRARQAEQTARDSRIQAERLLGYLTNDFAEELSSSGRLDVVADLARRETAYFHALPPSLKGQETRRLGALALLQLAKATRTQGDLEEADAAIEEALTLLMQLRAEGDPAEATAVAFASAVSVKARILSNSQSPEAVQTASRAVELISALASKPDASTAVRNAEVELLVQLGFQYVNVGAIQKALDTLRPAMQKAEAQGGLDPAKNLSMAEKYAEAGGWLQNALIAAGRTVEADRVGRDAAAVAAAILERRPADLPALYSQGLIHGYLGDSAQEELRPQDALPSYDVALQAYTTMLRLDPTNKISANNRAAQYWSQSVALWALGRTEESLQSLTLATQDMHIAAEGGPSLAVSEILMVSDRAVLAADMGDRAGTAAATAQIEGLVAALSKSVEHQGLISVVARGIQSRTLAELAALRGDWSEAQTIAAAMGDSLRDFQAQAGGDETWKYAALLHAIRLKGMADLELGHYKAAEQSAREGLDALKLSPRSPLGEGIERAQHARTLARALLAQERETEAGEVIAPVLKFMREHDARNQGDNALRIELAATLYVNGLIDPGSRSLQLAEASKILDSLPAPLRSLHSVRLWRDRIRAAS